MKTYTEVTINGTLGGSIWMPSVTCGKYFKLSNQQYPFGGLHGKATLRDMVLCATNDGDFQSCSIAEATVTFTRTRETATGRIVRRRTMDIRQFPSVADCVLAEGSDEYWAVLDCFTEAC